MNNNNNNNLSAAFLSLLLLLGSWPMIAEARLSEGYYRKTCPDFEKIVREAALQKQLASPTTAAGTLRLFFHDCMVGGCDGSVLVSSSHTNPGGSERDADANLSLPGDAFDIVVRVKTELELTCPGIVSCADILSQATRDLITMVGGPFYKVRLGRKDSLTSHASSVKGSLPLNNQTMDEMMAIFARNGFSAKEMVALSGGHTIGFAHCKEFADRLFRFSKAVPTDPDIHPKFAAALKATCANYSADPSMSAFNDVMTPGKFDNVYFQNLRKGLGLMRADNALFRDPRTRPAVEFYADNQKEFFEDFAHAMEKLSVLGVKTGRKGEVRRRCDSFNSI